MIQQDTNNLSSNMMIQQDISNLLLNRMIQYISNLQENFMHKETKENNYYCTVLKFAVRYVLIVQLLKIHLNFE